jgi:thymidylate synthase
MNSLDPVIEENISIAWAKAFLALMRSGCSEIVPLIVTVNANNGKGAEEDKLIRTALDNTLEQLGKSSSHTVANTIFPKSLWNPKSERALLYKRYMKHAWPRVKKCHANNRGTYFQRLIAFENGEKPVNQLEHILATWHKGNHRHSALQLSVFDPRHDHTDCRQMGFPCLHQVSFTPLGANGCDGLAVTGFYATQHIFEKAYGNYLGLWRLGQFVAHEMDLQLVRMTCIAASARLGIDEGVKKTGLRELARAVAQALGKNGSSTNQTTKNELWSA